MISGLGLSYFDILGLIFVFIFLIMGLSRGFIREFLKLASWIISLIGAKLLAFPITTSLYNFFDIDSKLTIQLTKIVSQLEFTSLESVRKGLETSLSNIPYIGKLLNNTVYDDWNITEVFQKGSTNLQNELVAILKDSITPIAEYVLHIAVFISLFIILMIVSNIILGLVRNIFTSIKLVDTTDKLLGGLLGLVKGCIFFTILYSALFVVFSIIGSEYLTVLMNSRFFDILTGIGNIIPK